MRRFYSVKRLTVDECWTLSTTDLFKVFKPTPGFASGNLEWHNAEGERLCGISYEFRQKPAPVLIVSYTAIHQATQERQTLSYPIELAKAPCRFGGFRYWFICPATKNDLPCRRRVMKLYLPPVALYFACRHCYELTYTSCQEHDARVERLAKNPLLLQQMLESQDWPGKRLAIKAAFKARGML